ncbi:MAG TPA: HAMP domain-containing sensor histidine kinase [Terriglobales bacterium]|nr:HAMP domain-containing sensor histidine kinase [Terriglobales bacterium]
MKLRLRTKFLLSMLLISAGLTSISLLLVRHRVDAQIRKEIFADLQNSVSTFQNFQRERETTLSHSADLLADLPNLRAMMTTHHQATIQDASSDLWRLAGSDLFVLADRSGVVVALHTSSNGFTTKMAEDSLASSLNLTSQSRWWFGSQHLYQVFVKPIYFGAAAENSLLGFLVIGYEINDSVTSQVSRIAASQVAFYYNDAIVRTTLTPAHELALSHLAVAHSAPRTSEPVIVQLGDERFLGSSVELADKAPSVRLTVLKSYDQATAFLDSLNRLLLVLGLTAIAAGSILVFFISHTFTQPLEHLVAGVRALEKGDFTYSLDRRGSDEVTELTGAFGRMRDSLQRTQQELLEAERLATIGRMASSISHDLRHSLAAIVANAEFLCESRLSPEQKEDLYQEIRIAVNQMTELIESLLEFSRTRESLRPSFGSMKNVADRAVPSVLNNPQFHNVRIVVREKGSSEGLFDQKKMERVFFNLLLNACEAVDPNNGRVDIEISQVPLGIQIRVKDNGRGIPESVQGTIFEPFVSQGKENGTGLGLTVVQKIIEDHGGDVIVEATSENGTTFKLFLPLTSSPERTLVAGNHAKALSASSILPTKF